MHYTLEAGDTVEDTIFVGTEENGDVVKFKLLEISFPDDLEGEDNCNVDYDPIGDLNPSKELLTYILTDVLLNAIELAKGEEDE